MPVDPSLSALGDTNPANAAQAQAAPGGQGPAVQSQNAAGMGLKFASDLMALAQAKKNAATQDLQRNLTAAQSGFPIDQNHIVKLAKQTGIKFSTKPEDLAAHISEATGQTKAGVPQAGRTPGQGGPQMGGGQTPGQQQALPDFSKMSKKEKQNYAAEMWAQDAVAKARQKGVDEEHLAEYKRNVQDMKDKVLHGSKEEAQYNAGKLMAANELPFNMELLEWTGMSDEQRTSVMNMAAGYESPAEFNKRVDTIADHLISQGKYGSSGDAYTAARALAAGQPVPAEVRANEREHTISDLASEADMMGKLDSLGVPSSKIPGIAAAAVHGGLAAALPAGLKSIAHEQLDLQRQQVAISAGELGVERGRLGVEQTRAMAEGIRFQAEAAHWQAEAARLDAQAKTEAQKTALMNYTALVDLKKAGTKIPQELENLYLENLGTAMGGDVTEYKGLLDYLTGGTTLKFTPKPMDVKQFTGGAAPKPSEPSELGGAITKFYKGAKKQVGELTGTPQYKTD